MPCSQAEEAMLALTWLRVCRDCRNFPPGEDVIVFLKQQRNGAYSIVGGKQGKFSAKTQPGSNQQ